MDRRRPIRSEIDAGGSSLDGSNAFRDALARWAATVTLVAVRDDRGKLHATTVTSFAPLSADPPQVVICLGPSAQVLPFATKGELIGVSLLSEEQQRWATIYADSFPVRSPEWSEGPAPLLPDAVVGLSCTVQAIHEADGGSRVLVCRVDALKTGEVDRPLLYWKRGYTRLPEEQG